jgi:hypothetical protein
MQDKQRSCACPDDLALSRSAMERTADMKEDEGVSVVLAFFIILILLAVGLVAWASLE